MNSNETSNDERIEHEIDVMRKLKEALWAALVEVGETYGGGRLDAYTAQAALGHCLSYSFHALPEDQREEAFKSFCETLHQTIYEPRPEGETLQ